MTWLALMTVFGLTMGVFLCVVLGMAIGVMLGRKRLRGSCGGVGSELSMSGSAGCSLCSNPERACQDFSRRMNAAQPQDSKCDSIPRNDT